jgi:hypothetical protein
MARHAHRRARWLHARISEDLEEALKREARRRRSPVSLVVRNVLEGALDLVEDIVEDSLHIAHRSRRFARTVQRAGREASNAEAHNAEAHNAEARGAEARGAEPPTSLDDIYGWQELILNRTAACARCAGELAIGANAYRGLGDYPGPPVFLCTRCVRRLAQPAAHREEEPQ